MNRKTIGVLTLAILISGVCLFAGIYLVRSQGCVDGRGTDTYFEKTDLTSPENLDRFDISNVEVIAQYAQSCAIRTYKVRGNWWLKNVSQDEFRAYIEQYNAGCADCLLVHKTGWPYSGEIFEVASDKHICSTGTRTFEDCVILQLAGPTIALNVTYDVALDLAIQQSNPGLCSLITVGIRQDHSVPVAELIDECQAQFAVATGNLNYCLTLTQKPKEATGTRSQQDICLEGLARELRQPDLCDQLHLGQTYQHTCRIRAAFEPQQCDTLCNDAHCQNTCYTNLAQNLGDPEMCRQITDDLIRNGCYTSLSRR